MINDLQTRVHFRESAVGIVVQVYAGVSLASRGLMGGATTLAVS